MSPTKSLSHIEAIFSNDAIKKAVRKIKEAYDNGRRVSLTSSEIADVQAAYSQEMADAEARTFVLVSSFINKYWSPASTKSTMTLEAICSYRYHESPIIVVEDLTAEHISHLLSDEQLTDIIVRKHRELQTCDVHRAEVEVEKSFQTHSPYDFVIKVLNSGNYLFKQVSSEIRDLPQNAVIGLTSRIKSPGDLSDKITDKILGIDNVVRHDKIPSVDDEIKDLSGIMLVATNEEMCYEAFRQLKGNKDILIVGHKDYIKKPKDNLYRALHVFVSYFGLLHEIQILDTEMFDGKRMRAGHDEYRKAIKEAREAIREKWFPFNGNVRELFAPKSAGKGPIYDSI